MHVAQYKKHVHQRCQEVRALISWERLHFGASDPQVCWDDFAWQVQHFVWPGITFSWQAQYFRQVEWKIAKRMGTRPSVLHSTFHFWRKSRRILSFLRLSTSKNEEVSQNCFVFDVVKCQVPKLRKSRWIAAFLMLSSSKTEGVSQNSFVSSRQLQLQLPLPLHYYYNYKYNCYITLNITKPTTSNCTTLHQLPYDHNNYYHSYNYNYNYTTLHYTTLSKLQHTTTTNTYTTATTVRCTTLH